MCGFDWSDGSRVFWISVDERLRDWFDCIKYSSSGVASVVELFVGLTFALLVISSSMCAPSSKVQVWCWISVDERLRHWCDCTKYFSSGVQVSTTSFSRERPKLSRSMASDRSLCSSRSTMHEGANRDTSGSFTEGSVIVFMIWVELSWQGLMDRFSSLEGDLTKFYDLHDCQHYLSCCCCCCCCYERGTSNIIRCSLSATCIHMSFLWGVSDDYRLSLYASTWRSTSEQTHNSTGCGL